MDFMTDEKTLLESDDKSVLLTTHRVRQQLKSSGKDEIVGITLEAISSCRLTRDTKPPLLWASGILFVLGIGSESLPSPEKAISIPLVVISIILLVAYVLTRRQIIEVASSGAVINIDAKRISLDQAVRFIDAVEKAKIGRS